MNHLGSSDSKHLKLYAAWDDAALARALRQGDEQAFAEIYSRYGFPLLEQAFRKINSREAAEEIVQDLFAALWHKRETLEVQKLKEYLGTAVKYRVINLIKSRMTHADYQAYCRAMASETDRSTEQNLAAADLSTALKAGLRRLSGQTQEVFHLSRMEHQSVPQIAMRLRLTPKAVEYHLTRALKHLRVSLKEFLVLAVFLLQV
ncbi:sigma-70 family RNA polymerase sigma factor [Hymenobacter sp. BT683]|uniref:Sigma-70 family RNA polymerase sigma factor n=1 Tax=Hymenobacter jeongseonensis TaxID=2791027 RepID=A0ABS0IGD0_9BACT|nr:sigma-70 family RNA polymerase sigma factor [Hymenobacter jeongseonensis]MBF9237222.1 sigma-70 family RNA polymerase sigma factor [Hymenobacter jeongseonensis]